MIVELTPHLDRVRAETKSRDSNDICTTTFSPTSYLTMSKTYFLAPTRDSKPSGPIFLGSIIKSPRSPEISLNGKKSPLLKDLEVSESTITNASYNIFQTRKGKVGIWAEFIQGSGIGGNISGNWDNAEVTSFKFDELVTRTIAPESLEVRAMFKDDNIQMAMKNSRFRDNLYMVTGIKIARGADVAISKIRAKGGNLHFGIDGSASGIPLTIGPDVSVHSSKGQGLKERHDEEFVFAYRLREIVYVRKEVKDQKEYRKGDLMGHGRGKKAENDWVDEFEAELQGLRKDDVRPDAWDFDVLPAVDDDGTEVSCVRIEDDDD